MSQSQKNLRRLVLSAFFLALCLLLPFLTAQIPQIGNRLLPMHIPALLCGFVCGWPFGLAVGFVAPLLRSVLFGMPPLMPTAVAMAFELSAYGAIAGLLMSLLPQKAPSVPFALGCALVGAMVAGRIVWGVVSFVLYTLMGNPFTLEMFLAGALINAIPGILVQFLLIPPITLAIWRVNKGAI